MSRIAPALVALILALGCQSAPAPPASGGGAEGAPDRHHHAQRGPAHHRFDDADRWAKVFDDPARDAWQRPDEVVAVLALQPGMVVADIGAGTGYFLGRLGAAVGREGRVLGLDVEPSLVDHMNRRAADNGWSNVEARVVAADDPGLGPASVDRILLVDTWHHLSDREAYASRLAAALAPEGSLYIVDFDLDSPRGPSRQHKLDAQVVIAELTAAGFEARQVEETLPDQYIVVAVLPREP